MTTNSTQEIHPMGGQPLHANFTHHDVDVLDAYNVCRELELWMLNDLPDSEGPATDGIKRPNLDRSLMAIRTLGYLISYGPTETAQRAVALNVHEAAPQGADGLVHLGMHYVYFFLRIFHDVGKRPTLMHSRSSSRSSSPKPPLCKIDRNEALELLRRETHSSLEDLRDAVLIRDNHRDTLTGAMDMEYRRYCWIPEHGTELPPSEPKSTILQCCRIISQPMQTTKTDAFAFNAWQILESLGFGRMAHTLAKGLNQLPNALVLPPLLHTEFTEMTLWLEATEISDRYHIVAPCLSNSMRTRYSLPLVVEFRLENDVTRDMLPCAECLGVHAYACRVAHMAGVTPYFEKMKQFFDDEGVDGSSPLFCDALHLRLLEYADPEDAFVFRITTH